MSYIFSTKTGERLTDLWLFLYRISLSAFMLTHGLPKLTRLFEGNGSNFPDPLGIGNNLSLLLAGMGEVVAPLLMIPG